MIPPMFTAHIDDEASIESLAAAIRSWEPRLDVVAARDNPMIYEPDGTLYAAAVAGESQLVARHKARPFRPGDVAVIPRAVAIDAEAPGASYVAVRHDGDPPYHFRERFIQTWGYEHRPASTFGLGTPGDDVIPEDDHRFRVPYSRVALRGDPVRGSTGLDLHLWVGLEGRRIVATAQDSQGSGLGPADVLLVGPEVDYWIEGRGVAGRFLLMVEAAHEARLARAGRAHGLSPEYRPQG